MQGACTRAQIGGRAGILGAVGAILCVLAAACPSWAQAVRSMDPTYYIVTEDNAQMKAGPAPVHYTVAVLKAGQIIRVDGETEEPPLFLRVEYLPGMMAFLKAEEATLEPDGSSVRLTAPSRLRAYSASGGERAHWWFLLPETAPLPTGTVIKGAEVLRTPDNRIYGFKVPAPPEARGYLRGNHARPARTDEIEEYKRMLAESGEAPAGNGAPAAAIETPPAVVQTPSAAEPAAEEPEIPEEPAVVEEPVVIEEPAPAAQPRDAPAAEPVIERPATEETSVKTPRRGEPATIESLQSLYEQVQSQPIHEAELDEVIVEFQRAINELPEAKDERTREFLTSRLELLKLRADLQKSVRAAEEAAGRSKERTARLAREYAELDRSRSYTVIGRLMPSNVYDGRRLPKMYRVQSVDEGFSRTVAYLMPNEALELDVKLGRVVGIVGETQLDPALRVNIVRPQRVDVLNPVRAVPEAAPQEAGMTAAGQR